MRDFIKSKCVERGLTFYGLCKKIGTNSGSLHSALRVNSVGIDRIRRICSVLCIKPSEIPGCKYGDEIMEGYEFRDVDSVRSTSCSSDEGIVMFVPCPCCGEMLEVRVRKVQNVVNT